MQRRAGQAAKRAFALYRGGMLESKGRTEEWRDAGVILRGCCLSAVSHSQSVCNGPSAHQQRLVSFML